MTLPSAVWFFIGAVSTFITALVVLYAMWWYHDLLIARQQLVNHGLVSHANQRRVKK